MFGADARTRKRAAGAGIAAGRGAKSSACQQVLHACTSSFPICLLACPSLRAPPCLLHSIVSPAVSWVVSCALDSPTHLHSPRTWTRVSCSWKRKFRHGLQPQAHTDAYTRVIYSPSAFSSCSLSLKSPHSPHPPPLPALRTRYQVSNIPPYTWRLIPDSCHLIPGTVFRTWTQCCTRQ